MMKTKKLYQHRFISNETRTIIIAAMIEIILSLIVSFFLPIVLGIFIPYMRWISLSIFAVLLVFLLHHYNKGSIRLTYFISLIMFNSVITVGIFSDPWCKKDNIIIESEKYGLLDGSDILKKGERFDMEVKSVNADNQIFTTRIICLWENRGDGGFINNAKISDKCKTYYNVGIDGLEDVITVTVSHLGCSTSMIESFRILESEE